MAAMCRANATGDHSSFIQRASRRRRRATCRCGVCLAERLANGRWGAGSTASGRRERNKNDSSESKQEASKQARAVAITKLGGRIIAGDNTIDAIDKDGRRRRATGGPSAGGTRPGPRFVCRTSTEQPRRTGLASTHSSTTSPAPTASTLRRARRAPLLRRDEALAALGPALQRDRRSWLPQRTPVLQREPVQCLSARRQRPCAITITMHHHAMPCYSRPER